MLTLYKEDFNIWELALSRGSLKDLSVENTMYDYFKEFLEQDLKQKCHLQYNESTLSL